MNNIHTTLQDTPKNALYHRRSIMTSIQQLYFAQYSINALKDRDFSLKAKRIRLSGYLD